MNDAEVYAMELTLRREADTLRRQRDELLQALRSLTSHKDSKLSTDVEYIGIHQRAQRILAQYEGDAVTGVTTQEDSDD